jgi:hypothetical protein
MYGPSTSLPKLEDGLFTSNSFLCQLNMVMRKFMSIVEALTSEPEILEEEAPTAPMKPGDEQMDRAVKQQQRAQKAPPAPQPQQPGKPNGQKPTPAPMATGKNQQAGQTPNSNDPNATDDPEAQQAIDTVDDGIEAGEEAKRILKQAGVIESYIAECVSMMFEDREEYPNDPDDGHEHDYEDAEGIDTGTDADAIVCKKCGELSAREPSDD